MSDPSYAYGKLSSLFYDAVKTFAPQREVDFYASFIHKKPGRVLEAMCGSGRLLIPLMQRGYVVDGVDNSSIMLDRCRIRASMFNLNPELYQQSLEHLQLPHHYTTVTIAVGSFQLIVDEHEALGALRNIHSHMVKDCNLLIDIFIPDVSGNPYNVRNVELNDGSSIRLTTRYKFDLTNQRADAISRYELFVNNKVEQTEDEFLPIVWRTDEQWNALLSQAGFKVISFYDETFRASGPSRIIHAQAL
jgi:SAM-dependent methyltransferase